MAPIAASARYTAYNPVVATTDFPVGFPIFDNADLQLLHNNVSIAFTVTATYVDGVSSDAVCKVATGITGSVIVVGQRDTRRTDQYANGVPLPIRDHNYSLNRLTAEVQETRRDLTRAVKAKVGSTGPALPDPDSGKFLSWSGGVLVNASLVAGSETLPGVASTFLQRNAGNTAFEAKTDKQVRKILLAAPYVATKTILKGLDVATDDLAYDMEIDAWYHRRLKADIFASGVSYATIAATDTAEGAVRISTFDALHCWVHQDLQRRKPLGAHWWGIKGDGSLSTLDLYNLLVVGEALTRLISKSYELPEGTIDIGDRNMPWRNPGTASLLDYNGIAVFGQGKRTIVKSSSADGADTFQLQAVDNLILRDMAITASLTSWDKSGSNGISITSGWNRLKFQNLDFFDLPGTDAQHNIDGGKAISPQPSTTANPCGSMLIEGCRIDDSPFFLSADVLANIHDDKFAGIVVKNCIAKRVYLGASISSGAPTAAVEANIDYGNDIELTVIDAQHDAFFARSYGGKAKIIIQADRTKTTKDKALNPVRGTYVEAVAAAAVDTATERITVAANVDKWMNGAVVRVSTSGGLPAPLLVATDYWVIRDFERIICSAANIDVATDIITVVSNTARWQTQQAITVATFGGSLPGGLAAATTYYIRRLSATTISLHPTAGDAAADTNKIDITTVGSGFMELIGSQSTTTARLASSLANALAGVPIDLTTQGTGTHTFSIQYYWRANDVIVDGINCSWQRNGRIEAIGNKGACDYKIRLGGAAAGAAGHNGRSEWLDGFFDIAGTAAVADCEEINSGGNTINNSRLVFTPRTCSRANLPAGFKDAAKGNLAEVLDGRDYATAVMTFGVNITPDLNAALTHEVTLTASTGTIKVPTDVAGNVGRDITIRVIQDVTGNRTAGWDAQYKFAGAADPVLSVAANAVDVFRGKIRSSTFIEMHKDMIGMG